MKNTDLCFRFNMTMPQCNVNIVCKKNPTDEHTLMDHGIFVLLTVVSARSVEIFEHWNLSIESSVISQIETKYFRVAFFKMDLPVYQR